MTDPVIRPANGLLLIALQDDDNTPATPSAATDVVPCDSDSVDYNGPYKTEASTETTGSLVAGAPLVLGQPATFSFRSRLKGAGPAATYSDTVKPPLHAALMACGMLGQFTDTIAAAALTAGTVDSGTLATGFAATAQLYRGMPLIMSGAPAAGRRPIVTDYSAARVAKLADRYATALGATNQAALRANWTYAGTSPIDADSRLSMQPCATIWWYEDGTLLKWVQCRGTVDFDGNSARPGYGAFNFTGVFAGKVDAALPTNPVFPAHSAPLLLQGTDTGPAIQVNGRPLPISKWSVKNGGSIEQVDDPNTPIGFGAGQISDRAPVLEIDPLNTLVATRNVLADIAAFSQYSAALQFGSTAGNSVSLSMPLVQPTDTTPGTRGKLRSETLHYQALTPGRDHADRDGDVLLCFD